MRNSKRVFMCAAMLVAILSVAVVWAADPDIRSKAFCLAAVFKALQVANPSDVPWSTPTPVQQDFMTTYGSGAKADLPQLEDKLEAIETSDEAVLNAWLAKRGFPNMNVQITPGGRAVATVFNLLVDWKVPGKKKDVMVLRGDSSGCDWYEGAEMSAPEHGLAGFKLDGHGYPLFRLDTRQGWQVYLVEAADGDNPEPSELPARAKALLALTRSPANYEALNFPAVKMAVDVDISWMAKMHVPSFTIDEAIKKVKLRLDEKGAHAQSAVVLITKGLDPPSYNINRPFYIIFTKEGMNFPPFVALASPDTWIKKETK